MLNEISTMQADEALIYVANTGNAQNQNIVYWADSSIKTMRKWTKTRERTKINFPEISKWK